jgi:hypothetical protein
MHIAVSEGFAVLSTEEPADCNSSVPADILLRMRNPIADHASSRVLVPDIFSTDLFTGCGGTVLKGLWEHPEDRNQMVCISRTIPPEVLVLSPDAAEHVNRPSFETKP